MSKSDVSHLIEYSGNVIITFSVDGRILSWNRAAERLFGWCRDEVIGKPAAVVEHGAVPDGGGSNQNHDVKVLARIEQVVRLGVPIYNWETIWRDSSGNPLMIMTTLSPVMDGEGRVTQVLSIASDIADLKRLEQEMLGRQRAEAILQEREMLARELHDNLSQNLSYVQMQVAAARELLSQGKVEGADRLLQRLADVAADTQTDVREQIRSLFSRPMHQSLVSAIRAFVQDFCHNNDIRVDLVLPQVDDIELASDAEVQMLRIIQEALSNVRKHARASHVNITLHLQGERIYGMIEDNGRGFDSAQMDRDGKQFGLRIIRQRAEIAGGCIDIDSSPGKGTRITIQMPYHRTKVAGDA